VLKFTETLEAVNTGLAVLDRHPDLEGDVVYRKNGVGPVEASGTVLLSQ